MIKIILTVAALEAFAISPLFFSLLYDEFLEWKETNGRFYLTAKRK